MAVVDEEETVNSPLIPEERAFHDYAQPLESGLTSPNAFIWALSFTAGISGILFGYE